MLDYLLHAVDIAAVVGVLVTLYIFRQSNETKLHNAELELNKKVERIETKLEIVFGWFERRIVNEKGE